MWNRYFSILIWLKQSTGLISFLFPTEKLSSAPRKIVRSEDFACISLPVAVWVCDTGYILSIPSAEFNRFSLCSGNTTLVMALLILLHSNISPGNGWSVFNFSKTSLWGQKGTTTINCFKSFIYKVFAFLQGKVTPSSTVSFQCHRLKQISPPLTLPTPGQSKHRETQLQFYYTQESNHFSLDFCILITTLSLHQPTDHLKWSNKASLALGSLGCLLSPSINAPPPHPSSRIFFYLLSPICTLRTHKMKPLTMLLERQSWLLAIKSFQLNQKYEGTNKNSKDSGMQTFLKITFFSMQQAAAASSLHITKGRNPHFLLPALPPPPHSLLHCHLSFGNQYLSSKHWLHWTRGN